jgi:hypothetical protein
VDGMTTIVVVHATAAPNRPMLVALCDEHTALLHRAARIDELVGFSTIVACEACALTYDTAQWSHELAQLGEASHLHAVPKRA